MSLVANEQHNEPRDEADRYYPESDHGHADRALVPLGRSSSKSALLASRPTLKPLPKRPRSLTYILLLPASALGWMSRKYSLAETALFDMDTRDANGLQRRSEDFDSHRRNRFDGVDHRGNGIERERPKARSLDAETASGVADFHALRAAYVTNLVASGAWVKTCQTLARHLTPTLTIGLYATVSLHDIKGAVENLPDLTARESSPKPLAMTVTDPVVSPISERLSHRRGRN